MMHTSEKNSASIERLSLHLIERSELRDDCERSFATTIDAFFPHARAASVTHIHADIVADAMDALLSGPQCVTVFLDRCCLTWQGTMELQDTMRTLVASALSKERDEAGSGGFSRSIFRRFTSFLLGF